MLVSPELSFEVLAKENVTGNVDKTRDSHSIAGKKAVSTTHGIADTQAAFGNSTVAAIQKLIRLLPEKCVFFVVFGLSAVFCLHF